jgi:hypothetical protein
MGASATSPRQRRSPTTASPWLEPETRNWCCECYDPSKEMLEYDYSSGTSSKDPSSFPRIRERGEYYIDSFVDQPWSWTFGTHERVRSPHVLAAATAGRCGALCYSLPLGLRETDVLTLAVSVLLLSCCLSAYTHRMGYGSIHRTRRVASCRPWFGCY